MKIFSNKQSQNSAKTGNVRLLSDEELNLVIGGQNTFQPQPSTPVGSLDEWCNCTPDGKCPYFAKPNSDYCKGCPIRPR